LGYGRGMFDWHFLRGVAVVIAVLAVACGIFVAFMPVDGGLIVRGLAAIPLI
jgi:hypothetical protein